ncbi:MAG: hypothetical protein K6T30_00855 [Alicyclobacillus sp.]|nr:hypothetical protein [Alicyclobacillus sp.]
MIASRIKTALLILLVGLSLVLSYLLWNGIWDNSAEVGFGDASSVSPAPHPAYAEVTAPYQVLFTAGPSGKTGLALPETPLYASWIKRLERLQVSGLHVSGPPPKEQGGWAAEFDFGTELARASLEQWLPGIHGYGFGARARQVRLYLVPDAHSVDLTLVADGTSYAGVTNLNPDTFRRLVQEAAARLPAAAINEDDRSFVPAAATQMARERWTTGVPQRTALVHSFFVNPLALTTIRQADQTYIWTDGSRLVWWSPAAGRLTYEDPNAPSAGPAREPSLLTAVSFIQDHGGGPPGLIAFQQGDGLADGSNGIWTFRPYVDGYPVVDGSVDYTVQLEGGRVVEYQRPLFEWGRPVAEQPVQVMGVTGLRAAIAKYLPTTPLNAFDAQLGYAVVPRPGGVVELEPAYSVSEEGIQVLTIDAVNGKPLRGAGLS